MRKVPVPIPDDTFSRLSDLARAERRTAAAQALFLIERGLRSRRTSPIQIETPSATTDGLRDGGAGRVHS